MWRLIIAALAVLLGCSGCTNQDQSLQQPQEQTEVSPAYAVLNKEVRGEHYILEISSQEEHEYVELASDLWNQIRIGDSVALNDRKEVIRINNRPIQGE